MEVDVTRVRVSRCVGGAPPHPANFSRGPFAGPRTWGRTSDEAGTGRAVSDRDAPRRGRQGASDDGKEWGGGTEWRILLVSHHQSSDSPPGLPERGVRRPSSQTWAKGPEGSSQSIARYRFYRRVRATTSFRGEARYAGARSVGTMAQDFMVLRSKAQNSAVGCAPGPASLLEWRGAGKAPGRAGGPVFPPVQAGLLYQTGSGTSAEQAVHPPYQIEGAPSFFADGVKIPRGNAGPREGGVPGVRFPAAGPGDAGQASAYEPGCYGWLVCVYGEVFSCA